jgi:hypothetical protein
MKRNFLTSASRYAEEHCLGEGSSSSPAYPDKSSVNMRKSMVKWCKDTAENRSTRR